MRLRFLAALQVCLLVSATAVADCTFSFLSEVTFDAGTNAGDMASGDFNHDGFHDLAVVNRQSSNVAILLGSQGGTFSDPSFVSTGGSNQADILAAYINNDSHLDLVAMGGSTSSYTGTHVQVLLGNGSGGFSLGDSEFVGTYPTDLVAGDFDSDGDQDIAVSRNTFNPGGFNLLLNNGAGVLTQKSLNDSVDSGSGTYMNSIAAGDFDDDGKLDVVLADLVNEKTWVFFGNGDGTFIAPPLGITTTVVAGHDAGHLTAGDLNGDGFDDIAVANVATGSYYEGMPTPTMVVALSNGAGRTFAPVVSHGLVDGAQDILSHDVDGDGNLDVVVVALSSIEVFLGAGDGTFNQQGHGNGGLGLALLDVDNDGGVDMAVTHFVQGSVGILQNVCGQVALELVSSANPASHGNSFTITTSLSSNPAATGTLTLSRTGAGTLGSTSLSAATSVSSTMSLPIGTYEFVAAYSGDSRFTATSRILTQTVQAAPFGPPPGLVASSTGGNPVLTWFSTSGTAKYEIWRNTGLGFSMTGETTNTFFTDLSAPASSALAYKVRAISPTSIASDFSNTDFTITHAFTDENLVAGTTVVKSAHLDEVRSAANALRDLAGLPAASWTSSAIVLAAQFTEVRAAINEARTALGPGTATFTDTLLAGVQIKRMHMLELRAAMR